MCNDLENHDEEAPLADGISAIDAIHEEYVSSGQDRYEPIAIIGMGCRFPGGVDSPQAFWRLLCDGVDAISEVPKDRWDIDEYYDPNPDAPGKMYTRYGGFLDQVDRFAPEFFNISPREALSLDPQQRLLLEVTWEALEHSNIVPEKLYGSNTGVYVGISNTDYLGSALAELKHSIIERVDAYFGTGTAFSTAAGRLSFVLRLTGPNMAIDTACSSSLTALHLACQSLRNKECDLALAAGVNLVLAPGVNIAFTKARMLAPDGRCKTFDASADGYVRGEGCGVLVLKGLSKALKDGDSILSVVRSTAMNQDGPSSGLTVPSGPSQEAVIRKALKNAGLAAEAIDYVEAHGTGTFLGDPIEAGAMGEVYGRNRAPEKPLYVGSVKTNIGHLESAAGVASLIKTVLVLQHRKIPRNLHFENLNPHIPWDDLPITVPRETIPWQSDRLRRAGVSGFGFSGTNVHVILEEAPPLAVDSQVEAPIERPCHLLTLSARSESDLEKMAEQYACFMDEHPELDYADVCYTANTCRSRFDNRLALTAASTEEARQSLEAFAAGERSPRVILGHRSLSGPHKVAFLFTGQGGQYLDSGRQLYETQPIFRKTMDRCNDILASYMEKPLLSVLYPEVFPHEEPDLRHTDERDIFGTAYAQPALFALEVALADLWCSWGIRPDVVVGHSVGEYAAAYVAGVFDLEDGLKLMAERNRLMQGLPLNGSMAAVFSEPDQIIQAILPYKGQVAIATLNGPENVVISGEQEAVEDVIAFLETEGIQSQFLEVSHAFHSHLMDPILDDFERFAGKTDFSPPKTTFISNLFGRVATDDEVASPTYWRNHIREPVRFTEGMSALFELGCQVFVEIGPHPVLLGLARQCLSGEAIRQASSWLFLPSLHRNCEPWQQLLKSIGELFVVGREIDWQAYEHDYAGTRRRVVLPTYPFHRERYWLDMKLDENGRPTPIKKDEHSEKHHPLLGNRLFLAGTDALHFESSIGINKPSFLGDHRIFGKPLVPGAASLESALAAGVAYFGSERLILENALIEEMLVLPEDKRVRVQTVIVPENEHGATFEIYSNSGPLESDWIRHGSGRVTNNVDGPSPEPIDISSLIGSHDQVEGSHEAFYFSCQMIGFNYGPGFQTIQYMQDRSKMESGDIIGRVGLPQALLHESSVYYIHPALLDGCFQLAISAMNMTDSLSLPTSLKRLALYKPHLSQVWVHANIYPSQGDDQDTSMIVMHLYDEQGSTVAEVEGIAKKVDRRGLLRALYGDPRNWMYEISWEPLPRRTISQPSSGGRERNWLILADKVGTGLQLAERLRARGDYCTLISPAVAYERKQTNTYRIDPLKPQDFRRLIEELRSTGHFPLHGVVHLWSLDADATGDDPSTTIEQAQALVCGSVLHLAQALVDITNTMPPQLWLVTQGAQAVVEEDVSVNADQHPLWGLGRVIAIEHTELRCVRVDLDSDTESDCVRDLFDTVWFPDKEDQLAYRKGKRFVARLRRLGKKADGPSADLPEGSYKLAITRYGILDNLVLEATKRRTPGPGEVEISVRAAGLNFRDVLNALGMLKEFAVELGIESAMELPFGSECSGVIIAVGDEVKDLQVGDEVIAGMAIGSIANFVTLGTETIIKKPADMSFEEAATLPIAFMTAYYGLKTLADLQTGEKVLIHAAAGGVGQAAVQLAKQVGAEIFATASSRKWDFLYSQGIDHVMDSRSFDYVEDIKRITGGEGVDVVLNSLAGDFIAKNLEVLKPEGRYVELGKIGILTQEDMRELMPAAVYLPFDLLEVALENQQTVGALLSQIELDLQKGLIKPLPSQIFSIQEVIDAFRYMAQAKHIGKVVLTIAEEEQPEPDIIGDEQALEMIQSAEKGRHGVPAYVRADACYLITGGLGALGLRVAYWLSMAGARHLVLTGRKGVANTEARLIVDALEQTGTEVLVVQADISRQEDAARLFAEIKSGFPQLKGVVHAAGMTDDSNLIEETWEHFESILAPKVRGLWNLHLETKDLKLDFFIAFSSIASMMGAPGLANYASANAFMDGLMIDRNLKGLSGLSINWGPWAQIGMNVRMDERHRANQAALGLIPFLPVLGLRALEATFELDSAQVAVMRMNWGQFFHLVPMANRVPFLETFSQRRSTGSGVHAELLGKLRAAPVDERKKIMLEYLCTELARVLGLSSPQQIEPQHRLLDMGLDSLMAVELINSLEISLETTLPTTMAFNYPTIGEAVDYIIDVVLELGPDPDEDSNDEGNRK